MVSALDCAGLGPDGLPKPEETDGKSGKKRDHASVTSVSSVGGVFSNAGIEGAAGPGADASKDVGGAGGNKDSTGAPSAPAAVTNPTTIIGSVSAFLNLKHHNNFTQTPFND